MKTIRIFETRDWNDDIFRYEDNVVVVNHSNLLFRGRKSKISIRKEWNPCTDDKEFAFVLKELNFDEDWETETEEML